MLEKSALEKIINQDGIIMFELKGRKFEFQTKILDLKENKIVITPIIINERILNLEKENIKIDLLTNRDQEKPILWKGCRVRISIPDKKLILQKKAEPSYVVIPSMPGIEVNRRNAFRTTVGKTGTALISYNVKPRIITIKDISIEGIGGIVKKVDIEHFDNIINSPVRVVFDDNDINYHLILEGTIVRTQKIRNEEGDINDEFILIGIKFEKKYEGLNQYIMTRQRIDVYKKTRNNKQDYLQLLDKFKKQRITIH